MKFATAIHHNLAEFHPDHKDNHHHHHHHKKEEDAPADKELIKKPKPQVQFMTEDTNDPRFENIYQEYPDQSLDEIPETVTIIKKTRK